MRNSAAVSGTAVSLIETEAPLVPFGIVETCQPTGFSNITFVRLLQSLNAEYPMLVTLSGIVTLVSELHPENAESPTLATLSEIVTLVSELQPENASFPIIAPPVIITVRREVGTTVPFADGLLAPKM